MSYVVIVRESDGSMQTHVCNFVDQKNLEVFRAFQVKDATEIEVIFNPTGKNTESVTIEKWQLKKPFLGIFGKKHWEMQTFLREKIR